MRLLKAIVGVVALLYVLTPSLGNNLRSDLVENVFQASNRNLFLKSGNNACTSVANSVKNLVQGVLKKKPDSSTVASAEGYMHPNFAKLVKQIQQLILQLATGGQTKTIDFIGKTLAKNNQYQLTSPLEAFVNAGFINPVKNANLPSQNLVHQFAGGGGGGFQVYCGDADTGTIILSAGGGGGGASAPKNGAPKTAGGGAGAQLYRQVGRKVEQWITTGGGCDINNGCNSDPNQSVKTDVDQFGSRFTSLLQGCQGNKITISGGLGGGGGIDYIDRTTPFGGGFGCGFTHVWNNGVMSSNLQVDETTTQNVDTQKPDCSQKAAGDAWAAAYAEVSKTKKTSCTDYVKCQCKPVQSYMWKKFKNCESYSFLKTMCNFGG